MRRLVIFLILFAVLMALVIARAGLPEPSVAVMAPAEDAAYNVLDLAPPAVTETAGSGMIAELSSYFLSREPTAKNAFTGALRGKSLILLCADEWAPDPADHRKNPALCRLARESAALGEVFRPDWYQGMDGRLFALLSGLMPTRVEDRTALACTGEQNIYLPFSLPGSLRREGYVCRAFIRSAADADAMFSLGFDDTDVRDAEAEDILAALEGEAPAFVFWELAGDGEAALARIMDALYEEHRTDTALCLLTADPDSERAQLYFWGAGLSGAASDVPCSELDVPPTLLNLFGVAYDARFLSGRDIFAEHVPGEADAATPLVTLAGSAFSSWVTDAGRYDAAETAFTPAGDGVSPGRDEGYVRAVSTLNYQRYVFARRVMETNYFRLIFAGRE